MMYNVSMQFSKRVVLVNTVIVIIPLFLLISGLAISGLRKEVKGAQKVALESLSKDMEQINEKLETFNLIEIMLNTNDTLRMFFITPESYSENEVIDTLKTQSSILENVLTITPYLYSVRLFAHNPIIPERWPMILSESRLSGADKHYWDFNYRADYLGNLNNLKEPSFCTTREVYKNHKLIGYLQIAVLMKDFFPSIYTTDGKEDTKYILKSFETENSFHLEPVTNPQMEEKNPALTERQIERLERIINKKRKSGDTKGVASFERWNQFVAWHYIPQLKTYLIHINNGRKFAAELMLDVFLIFVFLVLLVFILHAFIRYSTNKLFSGMYSLMDGMKSVKQGDYSVQIPVAGIDEVSEAQLTFNQMTTQIREQIDLIKTEQSLIADTEMKAMQNQINAHFLYNVLETIRMQAVLADQEEISESLQVLGKMMRYCLRWRVHRVPLSQEIEYIRSYVYILNIRNDYEITLEVDIPEEMMDLEIPKMTLQPLIENAFVHAIEATDEDATLRVFAKKSEDGSRVYLSVQDFGCGMDEKQVEKITTYLEADGYERDSKGSIGLKNIQQRLTVFYGKDYRLKVESKVGQGTTISVPVPNVLIQEEQG